MKTTENNTERDALLAQCWRETVNTLGPHTPLVDAALWASRRYDELTEALAAPAEGGQGESPEGRFEQYVATLIASAPNARKLGERLADLLDSDHFNNVEPQLLALARMEATHPAARVDVSDARVERIIERTGRENSIDGMDGGSWDRLLVRAALIDSAGGAKGEHCPRCDNNREVLANEADASDASTTPCPNCTPQPDGGDGAFGWWLCDEEGVGRFTRDSTIVDTYQATPGYSATPLYARPSAAAAVPGLDAGAYFWLARVLTIYGDKLSPSATAIISEHFAATPRAEQENE